MSERELAAEGEMAAETVTSPEAAPFGGIIDSHLHFVPGDEYFDGIAYAADHDNTAPHLREEYKRLGISHGIVMGNRTLALKDHQYPEFLSYCIGLDSHILGEDLTKPNPKILQEAADLAEQHLKRSACVGIKLYPGYSPIYVTDQCYEPFYDLAQAYHKPVAIHTGETAGPNALLRYSHPLTVDEAAALHPGVRFVMCHFGNPWLNDAAAVMSKNQNVAVDLSGLLERRVDTDQMFREQSGYIEMLRTWLGYFGYRDVMFGTDWPLANLEDYIEFTKRLIPERYQEDVFHNNACRIYQLG